MPIDQTTLPEMFKAAIFHGHQVSGGTNTNFLIPCFLEFIAFQIYQLAPMEFEEWFRLIPEQCKNTGVQMPELLHAREDLCLTLEMVTNTP